jgi:ketosteroid isomerase-like protein
MSQENVEAIRRGFELWNVAMGDGDEATRETALRQMVEEYHPDAELDYSRTLPDFLPTRGRKAMVSWTLGAREAFGEVRVEPVEYVDAGDAVVVQVRMLVKGTSSGASVGGKFVYVFRYQDKQVISATSYLTMREALDAVGLEA